MFRTLSTAMHREKLKVGPKLCIGPVSAAVRALSSIGWSFPSLGSVADLQGKSYNMLDTAPVTLEHLLRIAVQQHLFVNSQQYSQVSPFPWLEPIRELFFCKDSVGWGPKEKGMLRCVCSHGVWTKSRLKACGYDTDGTCECGEEDTITHRLYSCPLTRVFREQYGYCEKLGASRSEQPWRQIFYDAWVPDPLLDLPAPAANPMLH